MDAPTLVEAAPGFLAENTSSAVEHLFHQDGTVYYNHGEDMLLEIRHTDVTSFVVITSSKQWLQLSILFTLFYATVYHNMPQIKTTFRQMGIFALVLSLTGVVPFAAYAVTGITWAGMELSEMHRRMIDDRHAVLMTFWMIASLVQLVSYLRKKQSLHNKVGSWTMNYLLPLIFLELLLNAVFVFIPEKPHQMAQAVASAKGWPLPPTPDDLSVIQMFMYSTPFTVALVTPLTMMMYYWLSQKALDGDTGGGANTPKRRDIRLHVTYMVLFIYTTISAGILRWGIKYWYRATGCQPHQDTAISALMQFLSGAWTGYLYTALLTFVYCTLPLEQRKENWYVKASFWWYMFISSFVTPVAGWLLDIPAEIQCLPQS